MSVIEVKTHQQFLELLQQTKLVVVDFTATWCGPCKIMKPVFEVLAKQYPQNLFLSVDVDLCKESAQFAGVTAMPTFQFYKGMNKIHELKGANKAGLEMIVKQLTTISGSPTSDDTAASPKLVNGHRDLQEFISNQMECLNQDSKHPIQNIFNPNKEVLKSDVDEQLLLNIQFNQPVKIHSLKFISKSSGPKTIKTFVNQTSVSFDSQDLPVEEFRLEKEDLNEESMPKGLKFVKYQNVYQLTIFVVDNQDDEEVTVLERLIIYGSPLEATKDVRKLMMDMATR